MIQAIQVLRFHLLELEKVCFCFNYYLESRQLYKKSNNNKNNRF
jgi:hypothetical protein